MNKFWEDYRFILIGKRRKKLFLSLDKPKMPKQMAKDCNISISHVSSIIDELSKRKLIFCLTPSQKIGRIYKLTKEGEELRDYIIKNE